MRLRLGTLAGELGRDLKLGVRALLRRPGFAATALVSLALGIGANAAIFTLLDRVLLRPLPVRDPATLVTVWATQRDAKGEYSGWRSFSHPNYLDVRARTKTLASVDLYQWGAMNLTGGAEPERITGAYVTAGYFATLGLEPHRGRFFRPEEDAPEGEAVAVLTHGGWSSRFGADPAVVGKTVRLNGKPYTVVGVGPRGFRGTELAAAVDVFVPLARFPDLSAFAGMYPHRDVSLFRTVGRLAPGVTLALAGEELQAIARGLEDEFPEDDEGLGHKVTPLLEGTLVPSERDRYVGYGRTLFVAVALILAVACLNVAMLLLVRALERNREIALRRALGAGRLRIVRQLLVESLVLFVAGGILALPVARATLALLWRYRPERLAGEALDLSLDGSVLAFALGSAIATGLLFGLVPAIRGSRVDLVAGLKDSRPAPAAGRRRFAAGGLLVVAQVALAWLALVGAGLFLRNLAAAHRLDLGFAPDGLLALTLTPGDQGYAPEAGRELYRRVLERVRARPDVVAAGLSENRLLRGGVVQRQVWLDGDSEPRQAGGRDFHRTNIVAPGFFAAVGIPLLQGRDFDGGEREDGAPVAIVNRTMAEALWPGESAVGKSFHFDYLDRPPAEVVGVVADCKVRQLHEEAQFFVYLPLGQRFPAAMTLHVRAKGDEKALLGELRREVRAVDPAMPVADAHPMATFVGEAMWLERTAAALLAAFGVLALTLSAVGIFGVLSYSVRQRRRELGIRMSIGARSLDVLKDVLGQGALLVALGLALGLALALLGLGPLVASLLHGVDATDPATYLVLAVLLFAVAMAACLLPARRAIRVDPARVLRSE